MPIQGSFYSSGELQKILGVSKQRISNLANDNDWLALVPGLYCAQQVEDYLLGRGIDTDSLPIRDYDFPDGATPSEREKDYGEAMQGG